MSPFAVPKYGPFVYVTLNGEPINGIQSVLFETPENSIIRLTITRLEDGKKITVEQVWHPDDQLIIGPCLHETGSSAVKNA